MTLEPLLDASLPIRIHVATVVPAFFIGSWLIFFSRKGARWHRALGWTYFALMIATSIAACFVTAVIGPTFLGFGLIHLFVPLTLWGVYNAIDGARLHDIQRHRRAMLGVYCGALLIAGGLTFLPGRIMYEVFLA